MYTMSRITPDNPVPFRFNNLFYLIPDIAESYAGLANRYSLFCGALGGCDEVERLGVAFANGVRGIEIAVEACRQSFRPQPAWLAMHHSKLRIIPL